MKLILFDCDGTLFDSQHMIVAAMNRAFAGAGLALPERAAVLDVVGLSLEPAVARLLPLATPPSEIRALAQSYKSAFQDLRRDPANYEPLFPGARETLFALAEVPGVVLGIATGKSRRGVDVLLEREELGHLFATIQTADTHPSKPHPSMIMTALAETGAAASSSVMIGDTTYDMSMARSAGMPALGVGWGYHHPDALMNAGAYRVLTDYAEMPAAIEAILSAEDTEP